VLLRAGRNERGRNTPNGRSGREMELTAEMKTKEKQTKNSKLRMQKGFEFV
jgi:hypothetical protein